MFCCLTCHCFLCFLSSPIPSFLVVNYCSHSLSGTFSAVTGSIGGKWLREISIGPRSRELTVPMGSLSYWLPHMHIFIANSEGKVDKELVTKSRIQRSRKNFCKSFVLPTHDNPVHAVHIQLLRFIIHYFHCSEIHRYQPGSQQHCERFYSSTDWNFLAV